MTDAQIVGDGNVAEQQQPVNEASARCAQLQTAKLSSTKLSAIPADLPSSLIHLDLSFNDITHIEAACLSGLTRLTTLSLYSNRIPQLSQLPALPSLAHISLGEAALPVVDFIHTCSMTSWPIVVLTERVSRLILPQAIMISRTWLKSHRFESSAACAGTQMVPSDVQHIPVVLHLHCNMPR